MLDNFGFVSYFSCITKIDQCVSYWHLQSLFFFFYEFWWMWFVRKTESPHCIKWAWHTYSSVFVVSGTISDCLKEEPWTNHVTGIVLTHESMKRLFECAWYFRKLSGMFRCQDAFYLCLSRFNYKLIICTNL